MLDKCRLLAGLFCCLLLFGCGTMPTKRVIDNELRIWSNYDAVWGAVVAFFAENNIPVKTMEKSSGFIMAESQIFPKEWIDCGQAGFGETRSSPIGTFNVFVQEINGEIKVKINTSFHSQRYDTLNDRSMGTMECYSTGQFEEMLLSFIKNNS
jgi:hypothetical protein